MPARQFIFFPLRKVEPGNGRFQALLIWKRRFLKAQITVSKGRFPASVLLRQFVKGSKIDVLERDWRHLRRQRDRCIVRLRQSFHGFDREHNLPVLRLLRMAILKIGSRDGVNERRRGHCRGRGKYRGCHGHDKIIGAEIMGFNPRLRELNSGPDRLTPRFRKQKGSGSTEILPGK